MKPNARISKQIRDRIAKLAVEERDDQIRRALAREALPLYRDLTGCILLTPSGDFLFLNWETGEVESVQDPKWRTVALVEGSKQFPELQELFPTRPPNAPTCTKCGGSGRLRLGKQELLCATCSGLGYT